MEGLALNVAVGEPGVFTSWTAARRPSLRCVRHVVCLGRAWELPRVCPVSAWMSSLHAKRGLCEERIPDASLRGPARVGAPRGQGGAPGAEKPCFPPRCLEEAMVVWAGTWTWVQAGGSPGGGDAAAGVGAPPHRQPQKPAFLLFVYSIRIPLGFLHC